MSNNGFEGTSETDERVDRWLVGLEMLSGPSLHEQLKAHLEAAPAQARGTSEFVYAQGLVQGREEILGYAEPDRLSVAGGAR